MLRDPGGKATTEQAMHFGTEGLMTHPGQFEVFGDITRGNLGSLKDSRAVPQIRWNVCR